MRLLCNAILVAAMLGIPSAEAAASCDARCLDRLVDAYFAALVAHDPSKVAIAPHVKFVENITPTAIGNGLWKTASEAPAAFRIYVPDPVAGQVGLIGTLKEAGKPIEMALRLRVADGQIVEIEHLIVRDILGPENLKAPRPGLLATVPVGERTPRARMLSIGASYYEAITTNAGQAAPFADDCIRRENGLQTNANPPPREPGSGTIGAMSCSAQLDTHRMSYIKRIEPRRVWIADEVHGLVFGLSQFRQPQTERSVKIVGVPGVAEVKNDFAPFDMPAAHIFKIRGGKIHEIEAVGFVAPYNARTGWE